MYVNEHVCEGVLSGRCGESLGVPGAKKWGKLKSCKKLVSGSGFFSHGTIQHDFLYCFVLVFVLSFLVPLPSTYIHYFSNKI